MHSLVYVNPMAPIKILPPPRPQRPRKPCDPRVPVPYGPAPAPHSPWRPQRRKDDPDQGPSPGPIRYPNEV